MPKLFSPKMTLIIGTLETVNGVASIINSHVTRDKSGLFELNYDGNTDVDWNSQQTVMHGKERIFVDVEGDTFRETELLLK